MPIVASQHGHVRGFSRTWISSIIVMIRRHASGHRGQLVAKRGELRLTSPAQFRRAEAGRFEAREVWQGASGDVSTVKFALS
jgi:hypothetical protein